jgi:uncharacterized protein YtpQ (UPF0354 family)
MAIPNRQEFLGQVEQLIVRRFPLVKLERNDADFALRLNGHWTHLENLYRVSVAETDPQVFSDQLSHAVDRWVVELLRAAEGQPDQSATFEELRPRIYPVMLSKGPRDVTGLPLVSQQILEGLAVGYAVDSKSTIAYIPTAVFAGWGISMEDLHAAAMENLVARSETLAAHAAQDEDGRVNLILIQTMDGYDASRILLPGLHDHLREHLGSPFLAGIPNRDILVCFRDEPKMVRQLRSQIAQDYQTMPHQVTDEMFLVTRDGIAPYG